MKLFDPQRPRHPPFKGDDEGEPKLCHPVNGKAMTLPVLYVRCFAEDDIRIRANVQNGPNSFTQKEARCRTAQDAGEVFAEFLADPERCLTNRFGHRWEWDSREATTPGRPRARSVPEAALPDLDLGGLFK